jgi:hypothetical protein
MRSVRLSAACASAVLALTGCNKAEPGIARAASAAASLPAASAHVPDSTPGERVDSSKAAPTDSLTMTLALLPAPPETPLDAEASAMADRAVFAPLTQRWFMARTLDSALVMDIGRIDGGVGITDAAKAAFDRMVSSRSPLQRGMTVVVHARSGPSALRITDFRHSGRRIVALLGPSSLDSTERAVPVEWRGAPPRAFRSTLAPVCAPGDTDAIAAAIVRFPAAPKEVASVLRGCFGDFRALIAIRPLEITPETIERVVLVRANGSTRSGKLRDLSYPLHELYSVLDIDGDGTHEIVVHSFRMSMDTWAALRMTDSITFTRFASGFTVESR